MPRPALIRQNRRTRSELPADAGGVILVGGPPFQGKSVLAAHLAEILPFAHKLEVIDNLRGGSAEQWWPHGLDEPPVARPLRGMLEAAVKVWQRGTPRPVVIVAARAATPSARRLAGRRIADAGIKFLFVESRSHTIRAFERLSALHLPKDELLRVMARYERALAESVPVDASEMQALPILRLRAVLSDVDKAAQAVLVRWAVL